MTCRADPALPSLLINPPGHYAAINHVSWLPNSQQILTVSDDKSLRIWDIAAGECIGAIHPPQADGPVGKLYALAISPAGDIVAVGGYGTAAHAHAVYLIDLKRRRMLRPLPAHTDVILDLEFSFDGRFLAVASADHSISVWNMKTLRQVHALTGHRARVNDIAFFPDGNRLASASSDGSVGIWSMQDGRLAQSLKADEGEPPAAAISVAVNAHDQSLAAGYVNHTISIWSSTGQLRSRLEEVGNEVTSLAFLPSGQELLFTTGGAGSVDEGAVVDLRTLETKAFNRHTNTVLAGSVSPDGSAAATVDADGEIRVWRTEDGSLLRHFPTTSPRILSVAWPEPQVIAWGCRSEPVHINERGPLEQAFDLEQLDFTADPRFLQRVSARALPLGLELTLPRTLRYGATRGNPAMSFTLPDSRDELRCCCFLDGSIAVGSDVGLRFVSLASATASEPLEGHAGGVWAMALSPDGQRFVTAGDDRTLRIWSVAERRLLLSCFFAGRDWIAWTPTGQYASSPGGERLIGWYSQRGDSGLSEVLTAAQFRDSLYQPQSIRALFTQAKSHGLDAQPNPNERAASSASMRSSIAEVTPPVVRIVEPAINPFHLRGSKLTLRASAFVSGNDPLTAVRVLCDGRPYQGRKGVQVVPRNPSPSSANGEFAWEVELQPGVHQLVIRAETATSHALSQAVEVICTTASVVQEARQPDLYVLSMGISNYPAPLELEFADADAANFASFVESSSQSVYRHVQVKLLTNEHVTRGDFLRGLSWLRSNMTQHDVAVIFFSGHGAKDAAGDFYFIPADGNVDDLLSTCVAGLQFKETLASIPGRIVVLMDACHAGASGGDRRKGADDVMDDLVRDLVSDDYGVVVMCSSLGREYSLESGEHRQGYFTVAVLEGLQGAADFNQDNLIYLGELDTYLADRVKELTGGRQHPVTSKPTSIRSFPLVRVTVGPDIPKAAFPPTRR